MEGDSSRGAADLVSDLRAFVEQVCGSRLPARTAMGACRSTASASRHWGGGRALCLSLSGCCLFQVENTAVKHEVQDCLLEPWTYILSVPGKNVRGVLINCFNTWMDIDPGTLEDITTIIRDLHTASLMCVGATARSWGARVCACRVSHGACVGVVAARVCVNYEQHRRHRGRQ